MKSSKQGNQKDRLQWAQKHRNRAVQKNTMDGRIQKCLESKETRFCAVLRPKKCYQIVFLQLLNKEVVL